MNISDLKLALDEISEYLYEIEEEGSYKLIDKIRIGLSKDKEFSSNMLIIANKEIHIDWMDKINKLEDGLRLYNYENRDYIKSYKSKPNKKLQKVLNILTDNYYDDDFYCNIDGLIINIDNGFNLLIESWEKDSTIENVVLIKTNDMFSIIEKVMLAIKSI